MRFTVLENKDDVKRGREKRDSQGARPLETDLSINSVLGNDIAALCALCAKYANWRVDNAEQVIRLCITMGQ